MTPVKLGNFFGWYLDFLFIPKRKNQQRHECSDHSQSGHPPDVPDQGEAGDNGKECGDETGRTVLRRFDRSVLARLRWLISCYARALFHAPKGVSLSDTWQDRIVPGRRRRGRGPL